MKRNELVSIIMPTYNCGHFIKRAIDAVLSQSYSNWELIIIDNSSTDNTEQIIQDYDEARIKYKKVNNNGVIAYSRNKGIEISQGKWIAFLDADDWWSSDKLRFSVEALQNGNDFVYHDLYKKFQKKNFCSLFKSKIKTKQLRRPSHQFLLENGNVIPNSSVVLNADIIRKIKGISEDISLITAEDYDCWLRFALESEKFIRISGCHGFYWIGENNTSSPKKTIKSLLFIIKNHYGDLHDKPIPPFINLSNILFAIIKSFKITKEYSEAKIYIKLIKDFPLKPLLRLKLILLNIYVKFTHKQ